VILPVAELSDHAIVVPEGKFWTEKVWVPEGAKVTVPGLTLVDGAEGAADAVRVISDDTDWVASATLVAVIVTTCVTSIDAGAVYNPLLTVPTLGLRDQVTSVLELPVTVAANCFDWPAFSEGVFGFSEILTVDGGWVAAAVATAGQRRMVALADLVGSTRLVAMIVTSESALTELGAVYRPFTIEPTP
jgi:hypothetical protein